MTNGQRSRPDQNHGVAVHSNHRAETAPFHDHPDVAIARQRLELTSHLAKIGIHNPYLEPHFGFNGTVVRKYDRELINFSSYNYLGLSSHPDVLAAAKSAIDTYGTSVSASRVVSGEIPLYGDLESRLAKIYGVDDAIVTTSGYMTNTAVIDFFLGDKDIAICDSLVHNSLVCGIQWSGCRRVNFRHNDPASLEAVLKMSRATAKRALVVLEGHYSMDGDVPPLPDLIRVARKYDCAIMLDEAHSFGVLGASGRGMREVYGLAGDAVDIWMGTLSKALGSCGGFLAGNRELIMALKYSSPGLSLFTCGPAPSSIAAAAAALDVVDTEPDRVLRLRSNGEYLWKLLRSSGFDTGIAQGTPIVPVMVPGAARAPLVSAKLIDEGVNASAILAPAVPEGKERLRFFASSEHTTEQMDLAVAALRQAVSSI